MVYWWDPEVLAYSLIFNGPAHANQFFLEINHCNEESKNVIDYQKQETAYQTGNKTLFH